MSTAAPADDGRRIISSEEEQRVIFASSLGTVFEWYDFYIYATLGAVLRGAVLPPGNATAALLASFATYAAGFLVRPFGALVFGRIGDLVGRKYTFLVTIMVMGLPRPRSASCRRTRRSGCCRRSILVLLRSRRASRSAASTAAPRPTSPSTRPTRSGAAHELDPDHGDARLLPVAGGDRRLPGRHGRGGVQALGLAHPVPRSRSCSWPSRSTSGSSCNESPVFLQMKAEGKGARRRSRESFANWANRKIVLIALFGAAAGQGVVWYTGQFYALLLPDGTLKIDWKTAYLIVGRGAGARHAVFVFFGWLSDRIGRKKIMLAGCLLGGAHVLPDLPGDDALREPGARGVPARRTKISSRRPATADAPLPEPETTFYSECDKVQDFLAQARPLVRARLRAPRRGQDRSSRPSDEASPSTGWDEAKLAAGAQGARLPGRRRPREASTVMPMLILLVFISSST